MPIHMKRFCIITIYFFYILCDIRRMTSNKIHTKILMKNSQIRHVFIVSLTLFNSQKKQIIRFFFD